MKKLLIAAALAASFAAQAGVSPTYEPSVQHRLLSCQLSYQLARGGGDADKFFLCVEQGAGELKDLYDQEVKRAGKNTGLKNALKEYHVRAIALLRGINPTGSERRLAYEARQAQLQGQLAEAWARVEVEQ